MYSLVKEKNIINSLMPTKMVLHADPLIPFFFFKTLVTFIRITVNTFRVVFPGPQFMTYNVHQLLHLQESVEELMGHYGVIPVFSLKT